MNLPFLTLPDPKATSEGILDPLGLATINDRLADWILPGLTARMIRPRFLTAIAVRAAVCDSFEDRIAKDGVTPAFIVFEWLFVEGLVRKSDEKASLRTPGILKARETVKSHLRMESRRYLKTPSVFGFHGVYKRLARHLGIVDDDLRLRENGYNLIRTWEQEQGLHGFLESATGSVGAESLRQSLLSAIDDGLRNGYTERSASWQGWQFFARHLAPANMGKAESQNIRDLLLGAGEMTGEIVRLIERFDDSDLVSSASEARLVSSLIRQGSPELAYRLTAIAAYEQVCLLIEDAFDWLRYLSAHAGARPLRKEEFVAEGKVAQIARKLPAALRKVEAACARAPVEILDELSRLTADFLTVTTPEDLFDRVLARHAHVQKHKPPEGKREWFERASDGSVLVRLPYRLEDRPGSRTEWARTYRLNVVRTFCNDLKEATA